MIQWWLNRTPHELDVIRTGATVFGSALVPLLGLLLGYGIKLLRATRRDAEAAKKQTAHTERVGGELHTVSVTDYARHAATAGHRSEVSSAATRQEVGDLAGWVKGAGRRRLPTTEVPRPEESSYE